MQQKAFILQILTLLFYALHKIAYKIHSSYVYLYTWTNIFYHHQQFKMLCTF